jgi:hypothetical protein
LSARQLDDRILAIRRASATHLFNSAEWDELDKMRDVAKTHAKFTQAVREARHEQR